MQNNIEITTNTPQMLGIKETALAFGIAQYHARQIALSGKVKAIRVGRSKILINQQSVSDYFNNCTLNASAEQVSHGIKPIAVKL